MTIAELIAELERHVDQMTSVVMEHARRPPLRQEKPCRNKRPTLGHPQSSCGHPRFCTLVEEVLLSLHLQHPVDGKELSFNAFHLPIHQVL